MDMDYILINQNGYKHTEQYIEKMGVGDFEQNLGKLVDNCTKLGVILDFDGTLSFLAQKPALAIIPPESRKALERLSQFSDCKITVISGRDLEDLQRKVWSFKRRFERISPGRFKTSLGFHNHENGSYYIRALSCLKAPTYHVYLFGISV